MAARTEVYPMIRIPPHLEGNLVLHKPTKFGIPRSKRGFFVVLKTVIHWYESENAYRKGKRSIKDFEIQLEEVCGITEFLIPSKHYRNCSFSLTLDNGLEYTFSAESREAMEQWVNGLRAAKEFWAQRSITEEVKLKKLQRPAHSSDPVFIHNEDGVDDSLSRHPSEDSNLSQVHVTTWDGVTHKVLLPLVFDVEELLSALSGKILGPRCSSCAICKLQQSSMEVWTVNDNGTGKKLDIADGALNVPNHGWHFYLLVHNYKLLIIHFEDGTFQVLPWLVSLKAKEVPYLPIFADKLSSLGCGNFGLFLVNDKGTSFLFDPEEEPLRHSFTGKLLLKNRALVGLSPNRDGQGEELQKAKRIRKNRTALKKVKQEDCKPYSKFHARNSCSTTLTTLHDDLVFCFDHFGENGVQSIPEHTDSAVATTNGDQTYSSSERNSLEDGGRSAEMFRTSVKSSSILRPEEKGASSDQDDGLVCNEPIDSCLQAESEGEITDRVTVALKGTNESLLQNENYDKSNSSASSPSQDSLPNKTEELSKDDTMEPPNNGNATEEKLEITIPQNMTNGNEYVEIHFATHEEFPLQDDANITPNDKDPLPSASSYSSSSSSSPSSLSSSSSSSISTYIENGDRVNSSVCRERPRFEIHQCDFTTVGSPRILELVLKFSKGDRVNEEEVGEANMYRKICLSGWHLRCEQGTWSVVEEGRSSIFSGNLSSTVKVQITGSIDAFFHTEEKVWTVVGNQNDVEDCLVPENALENQTVNYMLNALEDASENRLAVLKAGGAVTFSDVKPKDPKNTPDVEFATSNPSETHPRANVHKFDNSSLDGSSRGGFDGVIQDLNLETSKPFEIHPRANVHKPDNSSLHGSSRGEFDGGGIQGLKLETSKPSETYTRATAHKPDNSSSHRSHQGELDAAIQGIFRHMTKFEDSPEDALDDSKHKGVIESVCEPLCIALWNVLSVGLRKKRFIGKHTVWDIVESFKDVSGDVGRTVDWVNNKYACLSERQKFQAFVCECLNISHGTLHLWLKSLLTRGESLTRYYNQEGVMFQLPHGKLEELVTNLSRISCLPFKLHSESWIKLQGYETNRPAFTFE